MKLRSSIRLLISGYITAFVAIFGLVEYLQTGRLVDIILRNKLNDQLNISNTIAENVSNYIRHPFEDLNELNEVLQDPAVVKNRVETEKYIRIFIKNNPSFEKIQILDEKGHIEIIIPENRSMLGMDMSKQFYFTRNQSWSDTFLSQETGNTDVTITLPYKKGCLVGFLNLATLSRAITLQAPIEGGFISVADRTGTVITSTDRKMSDEKINLRSMTGITVAQRNGNIFKDEDTDIYGRRGYSTVIPVSDSGWLVIFFQTRDNLEKIEAEITWISFIVIASIIISLAATTFIIVRKILGSINRISEQTKLIADGNYNISIETVYSELEYFTRNFMKMVKDIREREDIIKKQSEALMETNRLLEESNSDLSESNTIIERSLKEKEILLRELYHRTKNNMQVINSLLVLHSDSADSDDVKNAFFKMKNRIQTMSLVHQKLYQSQDLSSISMKEYITELVNLLLVSYETDTERTKVKYDLQDIRLIFDIAVPLGLFLNELISNSLRHAFPDGRKGEINISLKKSDDASIMLEVSDNGIGLPQGFSLEKNSGIGLKTALSIGELQLDGMVETDSTGGFLCRLTFSGDIYSLRI